MREMFPSKNIPEDLAGLGRDLAVVDNSRSKELLLGAGRKGFRTLKETVSETLASQI
jgi:hypothetical protein